MDADWSVLRLPKVFGEGSKETGVPADDEVFIIVGLEMSEMVFLELANVEFCRGKHLVIRKAVKRRRGTDHRACDGKGHDQSGEDGAPIDGKSQNEATELLLIEVHGEERSVEVV